MAMTYTWEVTGLKKRNTTNSNGELLQGAVIQTYWKCTGVDEDGNEGAFSGATPFKAIDVPASEFVPFEQLTEEAVLGWIRNVVDNDPTYWAHIQERVAKQIDDLQVEDATMPWAPPAPADDPEVVTEPEGTAPDGEAEDTVETANTAE